MVTWRRGVVVAWRLALDCQSFTQRSKQDVVTQYITAGEDGFIDDNGEDGRAGMLHCVNPTCGLPSSPRLF